MDYLAGVSPGGQQRVVAQHLGVAERRTLLLLPLDLTDRRVNVENQPAGSGAGAKRPRSPQRLTDHGLELADMTEAERAEERADRGRGHHPERQHPLGGTGTERVGVVDVRTAGRDRVDNRKHLPARSGSAHPSGEADGAVDQPFKIEPNDQRADQQQPGIRHQVRLVEPHPDPVHRMRYSAH